MFSQACILTQNIVRKKLVEHQNPQLILSFSSSENEVIMFYVI